MSEDVLHCRQPERDKKMQQYPEWISPDLAVGYAPRSQEALSVIRDKGIGAIVNLCAECYDLHELEKKAGFDVRYVPVHDEDAPSMKELEKTLAWIAESSTFFEKWEALRDWFESD
jgi:protein-tyrosine phosphatase